MTLSFRYALLLSLFSFFLSNPAAFAQPCLCFGTETLNCTTGVRPTPFPLSTSRSVTLEVADIPRSLDTFAGARYKAFWIFGDGNFKYFEHQDSIRDIGTLRYNYTYRRAGRYAPEAVLTEKKSNTRPPVRDRRIIQIGNEVAPGPGNGFVHQLSANVKTVDVLPSDSMRTHNYLTAFAVSTPRDPVNTGIYFFYNSQVALGTQRAAIMHETVDVSLPDYAGSNYTVGTTNTLGEMGNALGVELRRRYNNYIFVPITSQNFSNMPPDTDFDEYRIFPILRTLWEEEGLPKCRFLAVVVGSRSALEANSPDFGVTDRVDNATDRVDNTESAVNAEVARGDSSTGFFTPEKLAELERLIRNFFQEINLDEPVYYDSTQTPMYVRGMYEVEVPMVGSIDPNELEVLTVCPAEGGKYDVKLRLQVCNRGIIPVPKDSIMIRLVDHTAGLFSDFKFITDSAIMTPRLTRDAASNSWQFQWHTGLNAVYTLEDAEGTPYEPMCLEVYFTLRTNEAGVKKLLRGEALEMCAKFGGSNFAEECHFNFPVDSIAYDPKYGYNCKSPEPETCACGLLCILLIVCLLAILLWWFFKRND
ncbi:MAG: hypothetical protein IPH31_19015 [Lewinellaceae bacterium]|nr:hypothetical protein [Lewinellaceae bacterium]